MRDSAGQGRGAILGRLAGWARILLGLLLLAMVALNVANAAGRYLFGRAIHGSDEILVFAMAWLVFLGLPLVAAEGRHLRLDLLERRLSGRGGLTYRVLQDTAMALLSGWVAWQSAAFVARVAALGQTSMAAQLPMVVPHAALLAGLSLTAVVCAIRAGWRLGRGFSARYPAEPAR